MREYPSTLLLNALQCFFSAIQSFLLTLAVERDFSRWKMGADVRLLSVVYSVNVLTKSLSSTFSQHFKHYVYLLYFHLWQGIMVSGLSFYLQSWCIKKRGPVFLAMWTPLTLVITVAISLFVLGEGIYLQRCVQLEIDQFLLLNNKIQFL